jgi:rubrerythrin
MQAAGQAPQNPTDAVVMALAFERCAQSFYNDVATNARASAVRAFAAEMSADEQRHIDRLETLLARELAMPETPAEDAGETGDGLSFP